MSSSDEIHDSKQKSKKNRETNVTIIKETKLKCSSNVSYETIESQVCFVFDVYYLRSAFVEKKIEEMEMKRRPRKKMRKPFFSPLFFVPSTVCSNSRRAESRSA